MPEPWGRSVTTARGQPFPAVPQGSPACTLPRPTRLETGGHGPWGRCGLACCPSGHSSPAGSHEPELQPGALGRGQRPGATGVWEAEALRSILEDSHWPQPEGLKCPSAPEETRTLSAAGRWPSTRLLPPGDSSASW